MVKLSGMRSGNTCKQHYCSKCETLPGISPKTSYRATAHVTPTIKALAGATEPAETDLVLGLGAGGLELRICGSIHMVTIRPHVT